MSARDKNGNTPVLATDDDWFALILLRTVANPLARNKETALRRRAIEEHLSATLA